MSTAFDKLNDPDNFDESGKIKVPASTEGESGTSAPPAAKAEDTAASPPPPDAKPAQPAAGAPAEDKSGEAAAPAKVAESSKPAAPATTAAAKPDEEESEDALRQRFTKPEDKGDEWRIRAFREGEKLRKRLAPVQERLDRINSPERVGRGLDFVEAFAEPETPIADAVAKMTALSTSRTQELSNLFYNSFLDDYPDSVATDLVGEAATVEELKEGLKLLRSGTKAGRETAQPQSTTGAQPATAKAEVPKPANMSDEEWEDFKLDYPAIYATMEQQAQNGPKPPAEAAKPADPKLAELEGKVKSFEDKERERVVQSVVAEIDAEGQKLYQEIYSVVDEGLRDLGLDIDPAKDDDRTKNLKTKTAQRIQQAVEVEFDGPGPDDDDSQCSQEQKENRQLVRKVMDLLAKKDFAAARDYKEVLQARVDLAYQRVVDSEMELFNAAMLQPTTKIRSAAQQDTRPEIVDGAAASGAQGPNKTPWLDPSYKLPGETAFEAQRRYLETHDTLPGR